MRKIVLVTGGFDPIHSGHISYFRDAAKLGDTLVVGVNSDEWLVRKKGKPFMPFNERYTIVESLKMVDYAIGFDDSDGSAKEAILKVRNWWPKAHIIFANGGDRTSKNIPEQDIACDNISFEFGVGGCEKINSSSSILLNWNNGINKS